jgi:hypothetical protein
VCLIVVAARLGDIGEVRRRIVRQHSDGAGKSQDASKGLWRNPHVTTELDDKMSFAPTHLTNKVGDPRAASGFYQFLPRPGDGTGGLPRGSYSRSDFPIKDIESHLPRCGVLQLLDEPACGASEDVGELHRAIREIGERPIIEEPGAYRREVDL